MTFCFCDITVCDEETEIIHKKYGHGTIISVMDMSNPDNSSQIIIKVRYDNGTESSAELGILLKRGLIGIADDEK